MDSQYGHAVFQTRSCWCLAQGHKYFPISSANTSPDTCRISLAFFPNYSILLAHKSSSSSSSFFVSTGELQIVAGKLVSLGLHNLVLKSKMNPGFFRKLHDFLLHTDTPATVLPTTTGCLQSLLEMILTHRETSSRHSPVQLSCFCQNFTLLCSCWCSLITG